MKRRYAALAVLLTVGCISGLDANYRFQLAASRVAFPEGELDTLDIAIYDSNIPSIDDVTWSEQGVNAEGRPVLVAVSPSNGFSHIVAGVHPGYGLVTVQYRDRDASLPLLVAPQTVDSIDVPETINVAIGSTVALTPVFLAGTTSVHRHTPTVNVANTSIATITEVASSEPYQATVRGLVIGSTTATITSENGARTITINVQ